jgi:hypothetical protein
MKNNYHKNKFNVYVKKIKIQIHPIMIMIWTYKNMAHFRSFKIKVHNCFLVKFFLVIFLHMCSFCFNISYIELL